MKIEILENGILPIFKPSNISSYDVIRVLKKKFKFKKIGHLGTLDPIAEGVLPILINRATKLAPYIDNYNKRYYATIKFGIETDSEDITGEIVDKKEYQHITRKKFIDILNFFKGEIDQIPPKYAAIKIDGVRAYKRARDGENFNMPTKKISIYEIKLIEFTPPKAIIDVTCSKGTYIRSVVRDLMRKLDSCGTLEELIRVSSANIPIGKTIHLDHIETEDNLIKNLIPLEDLINYPNISLKPFENKLVSNGQIPKKFDKLPDGFYQLSFNDKLVAIISSKSNKTKMERKI